MPYRCAKFERNQSISRVSLVGSKLLLQNGAKKKKMMQFSEVHTVWSHISEGSNFHDFHEL